MEWTMCSKICPNLVFDAANEVPKHGFYSNSLVASAFKCVFKSYFLVFFYSFNVLILKN